MKVFELPDLGEGLADAELVRWLVAVGDTVTVDQPIAEVETAKSVVEVPSPYAGVVAVCHGAEGETIMVGSPLLEVREEAEAPEPVAAGSGAVLVGYGTTDHATARRRGRAAQRGTGVTAGAPSRIVPVVSPVVRALAHTHGIDLASLTPSGAGGVVTRRDVEAALAAAKATAPAAPASRPTPAAAETDHGADPRTGLDIASVTPFSRLRRTVAETMTRSRSEIPEATVWVDVDATELWEARQTLARSGKPPSMLAFVSRFALSALARHPELGGRVTAAGDGLELFFGVNLGFAADTPRGLLVPVIRRADRASIRELDAELGRLAAAARDGALPPADLTGSTFTVNNYGSLGVDGSAAIINHPEVAILGIGRVIERPWVVDGAVVARRIVQLSLVFDHRVTDGGVAARFLREIADAIESPLSFLADEAPGTVRG
ncbi:dihydrolipoamide acetyltransferase family protein [Leifsonia shinshuensis]|uniref:Dihydrolipoamide acetyltransferase component of pyruvate dehydrogenase complex n=1 Tax=Leifsonia shinshuensis TaxID=150026 RepID=A0A7G6YFM0_9MICO|nr:dihydrolipoamide acetyltransferase family protein [Leifsonia shinshuensis]QNE37285.1 2-oxo acid dehydrogenase subunit E2 [Leifsonia shinshuensis]